MTKLVRRNPKAKRRGDLGPNRAREAASLAGRPAPGSGGPQTPGGGPSGGGKGGRKDDDPREFGGHVDDGKKGGGGKGGGGNGGAGGGKGGGGKGGGGKGGGKNDGKGGPAFPSQDPGKVASRDARLAFAPELRGINDEIQRARNQKGVINSAYDAYRERLMAIQQQQQMQQRMTMQGIMGDEQMLQGMAGQMTDAGMAQAQQQAQLLGQGSDVADQLGQIGSMAQLSRGGAAMNALTGAANVGIADYTDLSRRAGIANKDALDAKHEAEIYRREQEEKARQARRDKGDYRVTKQDELEQRQFENQQAAKALRAENKATRAQTALAKKQLKVDDANADADRRQRERDSKRDYQAALNAAEGAKAPGGLSPSDKQDFNQKTAQVESALNTYVKMLKKGASEGKAAAAARRRNNVDRWVVQIAKDLSSKGKLSRKGRTIAKAHMPGGVIPKSWR